MKQGSVKAISLGEDAVVLHEYSNDPRTPLPKLRIYNAECAVNGCWYPSTTATLFGEAVRKLYDMLHEYYADREGGAA